MNHRFYLYRVYLDRNGYDRYGHYYGHDAPLYYYETPQGDGYHIRARNREDAKQRVLRVHPQAIFYR